MKVTINVEFEREEIVYLITDTEQKPRMILGYKLMNDSILYVLSCGVNTDTEHYECEISRNKDTMLTTTN